MGPSLKRESAEGRGQFRSCVPYAAAGPLWRSCCRAGADSLLQEFKDVRTNMIDLILATDMKTHFDFLSRFRNRRQAVGFNFHKVPEDQWYVGIALHTC